MAERQVMDGAAFPDTAAPEAAAMRGSGWRTLPIAICGMALTAILIGNAVDQRTPAATALQYAQPSGPKIAPTAQGSAKSLILPGGAPALAPVGPAADIARAINAGTPFALGRTAVALPFLAPAGTTDYLRAADCLAAAGYYEAGTRPADQRAVMQVVLNRVRHKAFPQSVCGVVFQGSHLRTGCQFTFTCDGAMLRRQPSQAVWRQAQAVAMEMLSGRTDTAIGLATHYHTDWVHPAWSGQMEKIAAVDTHLFFRWPGRAGNSQAFSTRYPGMEPHIGQLAGMSFAHRGEQLTPVETMGDTMPGSPVALALPTSSFPQIDNALTARRESMPDTTHAPDADVILTTLDAGADPDSFLRLAETRCAGKATCRFLGWTDPARKASQLPISGAAIDAMSFSYIRQGPGDPAKARWNCSQFTRADRAQCLRRGT